MIFVISLQNWSVKYCILRDKQLIFIFCSLFRIPSVKRYTLASTAISCHLEGGNLKRNIVYFLHYVHNTVVFSINIFLALCAQYCCIQHQLICLHYVHKLYSSSIYLLIRNGGTALQYLIFTFFFTIRYWSLLNRTEQKEIDFRELTITMLKAKTRVKMKIFFSKLGNIWIFSKNKMCHS